MKLQRFFAMLLAVALVFTFPVAHAASTEYVITSNAEMTTALNEINAAGSGDFIISLETDIDSVSMNIRGDATVTLLGNGHTISFASGQKLNVRGNATLNLGDANDAGNKLTLTAGATGSTSGALTLAENAAVNMYDGTTIKDCTGNNYFGGAVIIGATDNRPNTATFHMYGGLIDNCKIDGGSVCFGGAVSVTNGGTFIMDDGVISNCKAVTTYAAPYSWQIPSGSGGAVFVLNANFIMNGGEIANCEATYDGGAIMIMNSSYSASKGFGYLDSHFEMNGGKISNCSAGYVGGAIAVLGTYIDAAPICASSTQVANVPNPGVFIHGGEITGSDAMNGGGIFLHWIRESIPVEIKNVKLDGNKAEEGAGINVYSRWTTAVIDNCTITNNIADDIGGGIALDGTQDAKTVVTNSVIANNIAAGAASDVFVLDSQASLNDIGSMNVVYTGAPEDLTGRVIKGWFVDNEDARFVDLAAEARVMYEDYAEIARSEDGICLIAASTPDAPFGTSDQKFTLTKDFLNAPGYENAGQKIVDTTGLMDASINPVFTIEPIGAVNRLVGKTSIPEFSLPSYEIDVNGGEDSIEISLPDFTSAGVGDYWYKVTESTSDAAGVTYDSVNPRYLHIQVMWTDETRSAISVNTYLHSSAPDLSDGSYTNNADDKASGFTNQYGAGSLSVTKVLEGNMADRTKLFAVTITLNAPDGKTVCSDIAYAGGWADEAGSVAMNNEVIPAGWTGEKVITVYLKDDTTIHFDNIPDGVTYSVVESDYSADGYTASYKTDSVNAEDGEIVTGEQVNGKIADSSDKVTVTNTKDAAVDVGVVIDNLPYITMLIVAAGAMFFMLFGKKRKPNYSRIRKEDK